MKIAVIGTGYVGLVTGTCFAETGNIVTCVDIDKEKVDKLSSGQITIYEPGLEKLFLRNMKEGRLKFSDVLSESIADAKVIILALPTPSGENGDANLKYVLGVAATLGKLMKKGDYKVIVDKSTVPVGTADKVRDTLIANGGDAIADLFDVVSNPEFLREGVAVEDFMKPDRVVIGTTSENAIRIMNELYAPFVRQGNPVIFMDERSAELTKYAANAFLAVKISFMNEIAQLCERLGADVDMVRKGIGSDSRIGKRFLFPGIGYGGSCFPKDVRALDHSADAADYDFKILKAVIEVNEKQKYHLVPKVRDCFGGNLKGKKLAVWGLAFKPNTDDVREASSIHMIQAFLLEGAEISAFDPEAMANAKVILGDSIHYAVSQYEALQDADALIIATEWNEFRTPDFDKIGSLIKNKFIFDGRNLFDVRQMEQMGYFYVSVGRKVVGENK